MSYNAQQFGKEIAQQSKELQIKNSSKEAQQ